jgi:hypothetical protein
MVAAVEYHHPEPLTLAAFLPAVDRRFITATREQNCGADDTVKRKLTCIGSHLTLQPMP